VDEHEGQVRGDVGMPVTVAEDAAAIGGIDFNGLLDEREAEARARKVIADDGLKMAVEQAAARGEGAQPGRWIGWIGRRVLRGRYAGTWGVGIRG